ncbi:hypothetical protein LP419_31060 [Massilia sp. H-1]|nr:hypothetical protein LP419_31060 [Massilia sp. H-1]
MGRDVITAMVYRPGTIDGVALTVRNPIAAVGGTAPGSGGRGQAVRAGRLPQAAHARRDG